MGRLIDADVLREEVYSWGMNDYEPSDFTDAIDDAPTVEAIPKADYETRLKSDMVAMLEELKSYIETMAIIELDSTFAEGERYCADIIQQKINALKGEGEND